MTTHLAALVTSAFALGLAVCAPAAAQPAPQGQPQMRVDGKVSHFRQTFRSTGPDSAVTSLMRQTATGWDPNFPGSENLVMTRRRT